MHTGPEAGEAGSVEEQPTGRPLWLECNEPVRGKLESRGSEGLLGL